MLVGGVGRLISADSRRLRAFVGAVGHSTPCDKLADAVYAHIDTFHFETNCIVRSDVFAL